MKMSERIGAAMLEKLAKDDDGRVIGKSRGADMLRGLIAGQPKTPEDAANTTTDLFFGQRHVQAFKNPYSAARQAAVGRKGKTKGKRHPEADTSGGRRQQSKDWLAHHLIMEGRGSMDDFPLPPRPKKD